ncbi:MAG: hypothetical protein EOR68_10520 [Mesorhizobium sp.]|uniref:glycosyl hydrolase 108 family protein n=1 Tax=Mesorhizobium sp. TaxID=1871066 RepID=UPI000FE6B6A9|nr:glycosyl hydrolase 108 family protein [Mesorhizobium sp.]RWM00827.1 MAG: hypothetical protein EOR68_10520 [Mesorhizobium sp.]TIP51447.1 MAG: hypothetical protein E5X77_01330 [Mesorhizobium sp.]
MTAPLEPASLVKVLAREGGYSNNPADPSGVTMKGVTQRQKEQGLALLSVKGIRSQTSRS